MITSTPRTSRKLSGEVAWEHCNDMYGIGRLSPNRRWIADLGGVTDAETGERVSTFDGLPQRDEFEVGTPRLSSAFVGWESDESAIFRVTSIDPPGDSPADITSETVAHLAVRCSLATGACERIPHPADRVADLAQ